MIRKDETVTRPKSVQSQHRALRHLRMRVLAAFRALGHGVDAETAREQMQAFYRSSGNDWTRSLA